MQNRSQVPLPCRAHFMHVPCGKPYASLRDLCIVSFDSFFRCPWHCPRPTARPAIGKVYGKVLDATTKQTGGIRHGR
jgi:hypothetical protein